MTAVAHRLKNTARAVKKRNEQRAGKIYPHVRNGVRQDSLRRIHQNQHLWGKDISNNRKEKPRRDSNGNVGVDGAMNAVLPSRTQVF